MKPVAVISGGTRGIGFAVAKELRSQYDLVILGRSPERLARAAQELGGRTCEVDLSDLASIGPAVRELGLGRVDVLVHAAGVLHTGPLAQTTSEQFTESFAVNVTAVAALTRELIPALEAARGRVMMVNSGAGRRGSPNSAVYAASKFALNGLSESLRLDLGPRGIQIQTVAPGRTDTDMQRQLVASENGDYIPEAYLAASDVASAIAHMIAQGGDVDYLSIRPRQSP